MRYLSFFIRAALFNWLFLAGHTLPGNFSDFKEDDTQ
jgi:hypothetical protein